MNLEARLSRLEKITEPNPVRFVWVNPGEDADEKIAETIRSGRGNAGDRFISVGWAA